MSWLIAAITRHAAQRPHACALTDGNRIVSYAALHASVADAAQRLRCASGRTVALALDNGPAWAIADLALLASGRPCLPLPPFFSSAQQAHALRDAGAGALLTDRPDHYLALLRESGITATRTHDVDLGAWRIAQLVLELPAAALPDGTVKVTYTSGTTGMPKGVCLGEQALCAVADSLLHAVRFGPGDRHLSILPLSTLLENIAGLYAPLAAGACAVVLPLADIGLAGAAGPSLARVAETLRMHDATTAITVPELLSGLCLAVERGAPRPETLRFLAVGGARVSAELVRRATEAGLPVYEGYGLSECASVVAVNTPEASRAGSVGRVLPHARVKISADGEIHVSGATLHGYTRGVRPRDEWYATGDIGHLDDDGFLHVTGRRKNIFITSYGRNVAPEWIESELTASGAIAQAWVHGESRPWNVAVITPRVGTSAAMVDDAVAAANARLPDYARIRLWVRSKQPFSSTNGQLTANGRPRRDALLASYEDALNALYGETEHVLR